MIFLLAVTLILRDGKRINSPSIHLEGEKIFLEDTVLSRRDVDEIVFKTGGISMGKGERDVSSLLRLAEKADSLFPDAPGVVLIDEGRWEYFPDGSRKYTYHFAGLVKKEEKRGWRRRFFWYEKEREALRVEYARVIKPDGSVRYAGEIKIASPTTGDVFFDRGEIASFELPDVDPGDIVEYLYVDSTFKPWFPSLFEGDWFFGGREPVLYSSLTIKIPPGETLIYVARNGKPEVTGKRNEWTFTMECIPPVIEEPAMPPLSDIVPSITFSNLTSWDPLFDWYGEFQKRRLRITPRIKRVADSLTSGVDEPEKKVEILYHWVQRNIRYISIKGGASSGVSGHPAEETLLKGYGDCTDKAILFAALLRACGIEAYPVYINTNDAGSLVREVPSFYGNHAIDKVKFDGKEIFLDATGYYSRYPSFWSADHGVWAVNALERKIEYIPIPPPERNARIYTYSMVLHEDGTLDVEFQSEYTGDYESWIRGFWDTRREEEKERVFQGMVKEVSPKAELVSWEIENLNDLSKPLRLKIRYRIKDFPEKAENYWIFRLPELQERMEKRELSLTERRYPLFYETSEMIVQRVKLILPPGKVSPPSSIELKGRYALFSGEYRVKEDTLYLEAIWKRWEREIPPEEYSEYRRQVMEAKRWLGKPVILELQ
ncbi:hypothetical protein DRQ16_01610 [bacterium]|nr:MAG: hypothetical protein DRQ16_01610 [bacterium]